MITAWNKVTPFYHCTVGLGWLTRGGRRQDSLALFISIIFEWLHVYSLRLNLAECCCRHANTMWLYDRQIVYVLQFVCPSLVLLDAAEGGMRMQYGFTTNRRMQYISYNSSVRPWCCWMLASGRHVDAVAVRYVCGGASPISKPQRQRGDDDDDEYHTIMNREWRNINNILYHSIITPQRVGQG